MTRILLTAAAIMCIMCLIGCATTATKLTISNNLGVDYHVNDQHCPGITDSVKVTWEF